MGAAMKSSTSPRSTYFTAEVEVRDDHNTNHDSCCARSHQYLADVSLPDRLGARHVFLFLEYASRSASAVLIPELTRAFGMTAVGVSATLGAYFNEVV
jgi:hypothetical protein